MPSADSTLLHHALELSGSLLLAVTTAILILGLLVVGLSFRDAPAKEQVRPGPGPR